MEHDRSSEPSALAPMGWVALATALVTMLVALPFQKHYRPDLTWYWAISWDHGFVRRGLSGELAALVPGDDLAAAAQVMCALSASAAILTITGIAVLRARRGDPVSVLVSAILVVGPVGVLMVGSNPRPELLGFPVFLLVLLACRAHRAGRRRAERTLLGLGGSVLAPLTLASENILFAVLPWCVVLVAAVSVGAPVRDRRIALALLVAPPAVAGAVVVIAGRADAAQVVALTDDAAPLGYGASRLMHYVGQGLGQSAGTVLDSDLGHRSGMLLIALLIVAIVVTALALGGGLRGWLHLPTDPLLRAALSLPVAGLLFQVVTALDWPRWVGQSACGALLTVVAWGLVVPDPEPLPWSAGRGLRLVVCLGLVLLVPAVPYNIQPGELENFVMSRIA